jgi:Notch-like protein
MFTSGKTSFQLDSAVEAFNDYTLNVVEKLNIEKVDINSALLSLNNFFFRDFPDIVVIPITEAEIICTFASLKNKSSSGYDGISNRIVKFCGKFLGKPLAYIFNKSLTASKFPDHLKYSVVNPLFKKGVKSELTNYRPISLLTGFSKIF